MPSALASKIGVIAGMTRCRFCGEGVPADAVLCACRIERGEQPHTEWDKAIKRYLCVRAVERVRVQFASEQPFWERMAVANYAGTTQGTGKDRRILSMTVSVVDAFPFAAGDAAAWIAAGCPTLYKI